MNKMAMKEDDIRIEHIKVKDLPSFAETVILGAGKGKFIPISMQRAIAHAHNPYANGNDIGLLVAIDSEGDIVGYFGIMPILLRNGSEFHKVHWFSTWLVSPKVRGRGVGSRLMKEALTLSQDYLIVGSVHARRVCRKFGFLERSPLIYYWLDVFGGERLNPVVWVLRFYRKMINLLGGKNKKKISTKNRFTKLFARLISPVTKGLFYAILVKKSQSLLMGFHSKQVPELRDVPYGYSHRPEVELYRGVEAVNWMVKYPWVLNAGNSLTEEMDYYFSDVRDLFGYVPLEVYRDGDSYEGYLVLSVSRNNGFTMLKVLDYDSRDKEVEKAFLALVLRYGKRYSADRIEMPRDFVKHLSPRWLGRLLLYEKKRIYQGHPKSGDSPLAQAWDRITFHLADGDMPFS